MASGQMSYQALYLWQKAEDHEAVREWEARFAPLFAEQLRTKRRGQAGRSWYVDETYIKVQGK